MRPTLLLLVLVVAQMAGAAEIDCPSRWEQVPGWAQIGRAASTRVTSAGMMVGPLNLNGELRGVDRIAKDRAEVRFANLNDYVEPVEKWMYCSYGLDARMARRLPDNIAECIATIRKRAGMASIRCR